MSETSAKAPARKKSPKGLSARKADNPSDERKATVDPERYNSLVVGAKLSSLHLIESQFVMEPDYLRGVLCGEDVRVSLHEEDPQIDYSEDDHNLFVIVAWRISGSTGASEENLCGNVRYLACFEIGTGWAREEVEFFGARVGVSAVYPYFRQHLNHLSSESGAELPLAPIRKAIPVRVESGVRNRITTK